MNAGLLEKVRAATEGSDRTSAAREIASLIRAGRSYRWVGVYEVGVDDIYVLGWSGPGPPAIPRFRKTDGLCGGAVASREAVTVDDVTQDPDYLTTFASTRSEIAAPVLTVAREPVGVIDVEGDELGAFGAADRELLAACVAAMRRLWDA